MTKTEDIKLNKLEKFGSILGQVIEEKQDRFLAGDIHVSKAEIFRRHLVVMETKFRLYVGEENYLDEIVLLLEKIGVKSNKNEVAMLLSKTAKEIGFDRKTKKLKKVK